MMQTASILAESSNPDADEVIEAMDDVICRCGTYPRIKKGIKTAIRMMGKEGK